MIVPPPEAFLGLGSQWVSDYGMLAIFFGVLLVGELVILAAFLGVAHGALPMEPVFAVVCAAVLLADLFWFSIGRLSRRYRSLRNQYEKKLSQRTQRMFERILGRHMLPTLVVLKFVHGLRLLSLLWLGFRREETFLHFIAYDFISVIVYNAVLAFIAIGASASVGLLLSFFGIAGAFGLAVIVLLIVYEGARAVIGRSA